MSLPVSKRRLAAPKALKATQVAATAVTLKWKAPKGAKPAKYVVVRDGKAIARTTRTSYTDRKVKPGRTYRYAVRALDAHGRKGALSASVRVKVPAARTPTINSAPPIAPVAPQPAAPVDPGPAGPAPVLLTTAMVDRLFWRAGFGASAAQRDTWTGRQHEELVEFFLSTSSALAPTATPPKTGATPPLDIDPLVSDTELELEWIDRMQRAGNPLPERLAFFWHRHWAISRDDGIPNAWVLAYRNRLLRFADFGANPAATFRTLAYEMTTADAAMSMYLNINQNVRGKPNENYAREFLELFCLGPKGPDGTDNYSQDDVAGLAKAFTGWSLNGNSASPDYGKITFTPSRFELTAKTFLGRTIPAVTQANANGPATIDAAVDTVLAHPNHAQFLIRKLWAEFIAAPIPQDVLDGLIAAYTGSGFQLRPVLRGILTHPLIFESLAEPNLIKPPVVYMIGVLRALGAPLRNTSMQQAMSNMQQRIYRPPNVAGWEGGMSWLNTNTVQGRFDMVVKAQYLRYSNYYNGATSTSNPVSINYPPDVNPESPQAVFDRAYDAVNRPWISDATRAAILAFAGTAAANTPAARRQRFYAIQALMLGGPDGQVM